MARFLANENIPRLAVEALRHDGHDVVWIAEVTEGAANEAVAAHAQRERRLLLTFDKDFADLILRRRVARPAGVILCRFRSQSPRFVAQRLQDALQQPLTWEEHFSVIDEADVRVVPLPS